MTRPSEAEAIAYTLRYGCNWHGLLLSPGCCECGMIQWYRDNPDECRLRGVTTHCDVSLVDAVDALTDALVDYDVPTGQIVAEFKRLVADYTA